MKAQLTELGFSKGVIVETIVTTYNADGIPNAAPMGITITDEQQILIKPYNASTTLQNLEVKKCAVVNLISDVEFFYKSAFKEVNPLEMAPASWFEKAKIVDAPQLCMADAAVEVSVISITPIDDKRTNVLCKINLVQAKQVAPKAYCRAFSATIEAIIHATRIKVFANDKKEQEHIGKLTSLIENCNEIVQKVAPASCYAEIMMELTDKVKSWRAKNEGLR